MNRTITTPLLGIGLTILCACGGSDSARRSRGTSDADPEADAAMGTGGRSDRGSGGSSGTDASSPVDAASPDAEASAPEASADATPDGRQPSDGSSGDARRETGGDSAPATDSDAAVSLIEVGQFAVTGGSCGLAFDSTASTIWIYPCSGAELRGFSTDGTAAGAVARPGESANDVDIDVAPVAFTLNGSDVTAGTLLFTNGESGVAEIYGIDPSSDAGAIVLTTEFGNSHVVGGAFHVARGTFFAVQDRVPGSPNGNLVAEVNVATGAVLGTFSIQPDYDVNYGDLDVCQSTGNLFLVSSAERTVGEFTPEGTFVGEYPLPDEVTGLSGIGIDDASGDAWVGGTGGGVWHLTGLPCAAPD